MTRLLALLAALPGFVLLLLANWAQGSIVDDLDGRES